MSAVKHYIQQVNSKSVKSKIKTPKEYKDFNITNNRTCLGYKLQAYNYKKDIFINPIYNSFEDIKKAIDGILDRNN